MFNFDDLNVGDFVLITGTKKRNIACSAIGLPFKVIGIQLPFINAAPAEFYVVNEDSKSILVRGCNSPKEAADKVFSQKRFSKVNEVRYPKGRRVYRRTAKTIAKAVSPKNVSYVIGANGTITVYLKGETSSISKGHVNYEAVLNRLKSRNFNKIVDMMKPAKLLLKYSVGDLEIKNGEVFYKGRALTGYIVGRIFEMFEKGHSFEPMAKFLNNVMKNPNKESGEAAFKFLENKGFPLTSDGCFLGYKRINSNFMDFYSGKIEHKVGKVIKHPQSSCDPNRLIQCSNGLHVGTFEYARTFNGHLNGHLVLVKVNPKDIVCIPNSDTSWKIRVCEYKVIKIYDNDNPMNEPVYLGDDD